MVVDIITYAKALCKKCNGTLLTHGVYKLSILPARVLLYGPDDKLMLTVSTKHNALNMKGFPIHLIHAVIKAVHDKQINGAFSYSAKDKSDMSVR